MKFTATDQSRVQTIPNQPLGIRDLPFRSSGNWLPCEFDQSRCIRIYGLGSRCAPFVLHKHDFTVGDDMIDAIARPCKEGRQCFGCHPATHWAGLASSDLFLFGSNPVVGRRRFKAALGSEPCLEMVAIDLA